MNIPNQHQFRLSRRTWVVSCAIGMSLLLGCGGPQVIHIKGTGDAAVEAVNDMLEAWKTGKKPADLMSELSILGKDHEWDAGATLNSFKVDKVAKEEGPTWHVDAYLTFGAAGTPLTYPVQAAYSVTLEPSIAVFRMDHTE